jgi:tRNA threonylcarbamoyl adenosine modification protein YjeE
MQEFILNNVDEMRDWASEFARSLVAPAVVALHGDLGMGKSEIARAIIKTLRGADTVVPSPTFTIVQSYDGISHFDLYRIEDVSELAEIGLQHAIDNDITLIEWPDIASNVLPENTIHINIVQYGNGRKITLNTKQE